MEENLPLVYKKVENEQGNYIGQDGKRYEIQTCHITESKEQVQVGTTTETDEEGNEIEVTVYESRVVINKGWTAFESEEEAAAAWDLTPVDEEE